MKGIIVVDIPNCCGECFYLSQNGECVANGISTVCYQNSKPLWCPIKPVPETKEVPKGFMIGEIYGEEIGWNKCIDEILKGESDEH